MPICIIKETIEQEEVTTDAQGNAWLIKRVNLEQGKMHSLL